ncbi:hypothetical protein [Chryseobacterium arthrosphaerae]|uniref:hypothetical protein n=1 Tax=Chryseobacterium arthrosphaerae TaxID=651561 RepID=UPI001F4ADC24|nr:hypothetical protein [Chryseobacterium arthrosphaerae]
MSTATNLIMQDILTLISRKTQDVDYVNSCQTILIPITINLDELIFYPDQQLVKDAFACLASLNMQWIPFKDSKDGSKKVLLSVMNFMNIIEDKIVFKVPCFFLSEFAKVDFSLERYNCKR